MLLMPEEFRDSLLAYLGQRPYREVAGAVLALERLDVAPTAEKTTTVETKPPSDEAGQ